MKLNLDCMRDVLLEMEKAPYGESIHPKAIHSALSGYNSADIDYSIIKLEEANFIRAVIAKHDNGITILHLDDITYDGHQFLACIRSRSVWEKTKETCIKLGVSSIPVIVNIANQIISNTFPRLFS